tara:strand:+ start:715 stop:1497 length:783 start_codon:yes stop_codon:yes gene_type:complete
VSINIKKIFTAITNIPFAVVIISIALLSSLSAYLYWEKLNDNNLLLEYEDYVQRLLSQVEESKVKEIAQEIELARLRDELDALNANLVTITESPISTEDNSASDYQESDKEMRQRIIYEYELENANNNSDRALELIKEITSLDPSSINEIMSLQRQFGSFIQALNVNDGRMEEIVGVLTDYVSGQSQARQQILLEARSEQIDRRQVGTLMRAVMDREFMYEELSSHLTQSEISLLQQTHAEQASQEEFDGRPSSGFRGSR